MQSSYPIPYLSCTATSPMTIFISFLFILPDFVYANQMKLHFYYIVQKIKYYAL